MKKISLFLVVLAAIGMSMTGYAEEQESSSSAGIVENESVTIDSKTTDESIELGQDSKSNIEKVQQQNLNEIEWLARLLLNKVITQEEYNEILKELDEAVTESEKQEVINKLLETNMPANHFTWAFSERFINIRINIDGLKKDGFISESEANDFYTQLDACDSLEDLQKVSDAIRLYIDKYYGEGGNSNSREETSQIIKESTKTETTMSSKAEVKVPADKAKKGMLPQTGENIGLGLAIIGVLVVSSVVLVSWRKKSAMNKQ